MTGTLGSGDNPLSRVTVGSLEDMGYVVDYTSADPFTAADLGPGCTCRRRNLRNRQQGEVFLLGSDSREHRRDLQEPLSEELRKYAIQAGLKILDESADFAGRTSYGDAIYVGDKAVSIIMLQGKQLYSVVVTQADNYDL